MIPALPGNAIGAAAKLAGPALSGRVQPLVNMGKAAANAYSALPPDVQSQIRAKAAGAMDAVGGNIRSRTSTGNGNRGRGTPPPPAAIFGNGSSGHSSGYALTRHTNPANSNLDSGIVPNAYATDTMNAEENACSPMHITSAVLTIPTDTSNEIYKYFINNVAFDIQNRAQANVGYNLNIATTFTTTNILKAMNDLIYALNIYFYFRGIISFAAVPSNRNGAATYLRKQITPQMIEDLTMLGDKLSDTPCPPNLLELIRWLNTTYTSSDVPGAPLLKYSPIYSSSTMVDGTKITDALNGLNGIVNTTNPDIFVQLRKAVPHWVPAILADPPNTPVFDRQFLTLFANMNAKYWVSGTTLNFYNIAANESAEIPYCSYTNALDGVVYALTDIYVTSRSGNLPGLMTTFPNSGTASSTNGPSRRSFYSVSGTEGFYVSQNYPILKVARQETTTLDASNTAYNVHLFGTKRLKGVSYNAVRENCYEVLSYLMNVDSIYQPAMMPKASISFSKRAKK